MTDAEFREAVLDNYWKAAASWTKRLEDMRALNNPRLVSVVKELEWDLKSLLAMLERKGGGTSPPTST